MLRRLAPLLILAAFVLVPPTAFGQEEGKLPEDAQIVLEEMTEALELSEEQVEQVGKLMGKFMQDLHVATETPEGEEGDRQAMLSGVKKARAEYNTGLQGVLSEEQFVIYEEMVDQTFQDIFEGLAGIKIIDLQPVLELTDEQAEALEPVMGTAMRQMVAVLVEYGDQRLTKPKKIQVGKKLKKINSNMQAGMQEVLTEEQWAKYEAMKEEAKNKDKS
jgi:hypothetical protein